MTQSEILSSLCYYDRRNPNFEINTIQYENGNCITIRLTNK